MPGFELKMPKLGESVTEGTIGKWLKRPGEKVNKYDLLVEVQTDKVTTEIPSPVSGTLREVKVEEGQTVPIGTLLAVFDTADETAGTSQPQPSAPPPQTRSEEHTSELQSRSDLVCRLLLEKKKKKKNVTKPYPQNNPLNNT